MATCRVASDPFLWAILTARPCPDLDPFFQALAQDDVELARSYVEDDLKADFAERVSNWHLTNAVSWRCVYSDDISYPRIGGRSSMRCGAEFEVARFDCAAKCARITHGDVLPYSHVLRPSAHIANRIRTRGVVEFTAGLLLAPCPLQKKAASRNGIPPASAARFAPPRARCRPCR